MGAWKWKNSLMKQMLDVLKIWYVIYVDIIICLIVFIRFTIYYINDKRCNAKAKLNFPSAALFDDVAPYYLIQFKSNLNDPYGITRDYLNKINSSSS